MGVVETALLTVVAPLIAALIGAAWGRRSSKEANDIASFSALVDGFAKRVDTLEDEVRELKRSLGKEQDEHRRTRQLLGVALRHIRDIVAWSLGDRLLPIPVPPQELLEQIL